MPLLLTNLKVLDAKLNRQELKFNRELERLYSGLESTVTRQASSYRKNKDFVISTTKQQGLEKAFKQHFKEVEKIAAGNTRRELLKFTKTEDERNKILSLSPSKNNKSNIIYAQKLASKQVTDFEDKIKDKINQELKLNPKLSTREIKKIIEGESLSFKNTRLTVTSETEANRVANNTKLQLYKKAGVKKKRFTAVLDNRTTNFCKQHNGKVYDINDNTIVFPTHPRERSYWTAVMD